MRVAWVADVHIGNHRRFGGRIVSGLNRRAREGVAVFKEALAGAKDCDAFIVSGDLLDVVRPEPQLLAEVQAVLAEASVPVYVLLGNHEMVSASAGDHALGPLSPVAEIVERPRLLRLGWVEVGLVPFQPGDARSWLPGVLGDLFAPPRRGPRVLGLHLGIADEKTPPWLRGAPDSIEVDVLRGLAVHHGVGAVFAGNWHDRRVWGDPSRCGVSSRGAYSPLIFQLGALVPTGFDNPGLCGYGTLAIWDPEHGVSFSEVPGPRFVKLGADEPIPQPPPGVRVYVSVTVPAHKMREAASAVAARVADGTILDGEVLPDGREAVVEARAAASAAKSAETIDEAVSGYVAAMPLPGEVDRAQVLDRVQKYLK